MLLGKRLWYKYRLSWSILLFLLLAWGIHQYKPTLLYTPQGAFRPFGVGYRHKTITPIWFIFMILALCCYMFLCTFL